MELKKINVEGRVMTLSKLNACPGAYIAFTVNAGKIQHWVVEEDGGEWIATVEGDEEELELSDEQREAILNFEE